MRKWRNFILSLLCTFGAYFLLFHEFDIVAKPTISEANLSKSVDKKTSKNQARTDSLEVNIGK